MKIFCWDYILLDFDVTLHPHQETLDKLANAGVKVYRNDLAGDIVLTTDGISYSVNVSPSQHIPTISTGKININTADLEILQQITGVGPVIAQRIIDYRNTHGPFQQIDDIKKVSGIGNVTFDNMKEQITVGD